MSLETNAQAFTLVVSECNLLESQQLPRRVLDNTLCFNAEIEITLQQMHDFVKNLEIHAKVLKSKKGNLGDWARYKSLEQVFREQVELGFTIIDKAKQLILLEKVDSKLSRNTNNSSDFSLQTKTSDHINSQRSTTLVSRCGPELQTIIDRFNSILKINGENSYLPSGVKDPEKEPVENKNELIEKNILKFMWNHLAENELKLEFNMLPIKYNGAQSEYSFTCKLLHYAVEGHGYDFMSAKTDAAIKMIKLIIEKQTTKTLPDNIPPFQRDTLETLICVLSLTEDFVSELQELCQTKMVDQPEYKTLSNKKPYRIKCYALDQIAYGTHSNIQIAKRIASKRIINMYRASVTGQKLL